MFAFFVAIIFGFGVGTMNEKTNTYHACERDNFAGKVCESVKPNDKI